MKSLITLLTLSYFSFLLFSCKDKVKDDPLPATPTPIPPVVKEEQLPPITTTGAGTFGCKVNGKVWVAKTNKDFPRVYASVNKKLNWYLLIAGSQINKEVQFDLINLRCYDAPFKQRHQLFMLDTDNPSASYTNTIKNEFWNTNQLMGGEVQLIIFDSVKQIVAGTFHFDCINQETKDTLHITDGRFDMNFLY